MATGVKTEVVEAAVCIYTLIHLYEYEYVHTSICVRCISMSACVKAARRSNAAIEA